MVHKLSHTGELPFRCSYCNAGFKEKRNMLKHEAKNHAHLEGWPGEEEDRKTISPEPHIKQLKTKTPKKKKPEEKKHEIFGDWPGKEEGRGSVSPSGSPKGSLPLTSPQGTPLPLASPPQGTPIPLTRSSSPSCPSAPLPPPPAPPSQPCRDFQTLKMIRLEKLGLTFF